jgi:hypothetical protein
MYTEGVAAKVVRTLEEVLAAFAAAPPPTPDDVTITADGRHIDSRDKALAWVAEMNALPRNGHHDTGG